MRERDRKKAASLAAKELNRLKPSLSRVCTVCNDEFTCTHPGAQYCGNTCKCRAYQLRRRAAAAGGA
jgi:hypothetical protein